LGDDGYIHGFERDEMRRLTRMQRIINEAELAAIDLAGVRSLLDVGAGLGQLTRAFARRLGTGSRVLGIERDARQRAEAERQAELAAETGLVEIRAGEATRLPLTVEERGSFDLAHARFLLEHVTDPLAVVREMVSAVRKGGRLVLVDDDHELLRLSPDCPPLLDAWRRYWQGYADLGCDPLIGRRLPGLLHRAGARPTRVTTVFYGGVHGDPIFDLAVDNLAGVLRGAAGRLDSMGRVARSEMSSALEALAEWRNDPAATLWYSLPLAEGVRAD